MAGSKKVLKMKEHQELLFGGATVGQRTEGCFTGGGVIFKTDADRVEISAKLSYKIRGNLQTTGITALRGIASTISEDNGVAWRNLRIVSSNNEFHVKFPMLRYVESKPYIISTWFPIMANVDDIVFILTSDQNINIEPYKFSGKCLLIGGPFTYGIGATTTSNTIPNIILKKTGMETFNAGKNDWHYMQFFPEDALLRFKPDIIVVECDTPKTSLSELTGSLEDYLRRINRCVPDAKLILWTQPFIEEVNDYTKRREFILVTAEKLKNEINIDIVDGKEILNDETREVYVYSSLYVSESALVETGMKIAEKIRTAK